MKKLKTINSHSGLARWLAEVDQKALGFAPRSVTKHIPSPYRYSPSVEVLSWKGKPVVWFEVAHKRYQVFEAPDVIYPTDEEATRHHLAEASWPDGGS